MRASIEQIPQISPMVRELWPEHPIRAGKDPERLYRRGGIRRFCGVRERVDRRHHILLLMLILVIFGMTGCSRYVSHYAAILHVRSNTSDSASLLFHELDGTEVFKLKCKNGKTAKIQYSGELESGSMVVYYDCGGAKTELFSVQAGDEITAYSDPLPAGTVYVILETGEKCEGGAFSFEIVYD